ncbi:MAG: DUF1501 domain-containing protein, partial [Planctomycetes bacterium]|nr:DUF1501 domain-containing protein [Planctomycetota bacterium]
MLTMLGSPRRCCDGLTRRETLRVGALSALGGFGLADYLAANPPLPPLSKGGTDGFPPLTKGGPGGVGRAKSVIVLYLLGGAATQDMFDLKPGAPAEVRGEFNPIATSEPGIEICEHLPQSARWMHRAAIVRSLNHRAGCHNTLPSYTGHEVLLPDITTTSESYPPSMGSVCEYLRQNGEAPRDFPAYVYLPCHLGWGQAIRRPGPYGGFLGKRYDALTTECDPHKADDAPEPLPGQPQTVLGTPRLPQSQLQEGVTIDRLNLRRTLLEQIDDGLRR